MSSLTRITGALVDVVSPLCFTDAETLARVLGYENIAADLTGAANQIVTSVQTLHQSADTVEEIWSTEGEVDASDALSEITTFFTALGDLINGIKDFAAIIEGSIGGVDPNDLVESVSDRLIGWLVVGYMRQRFPAANRLLHILTIFQSKYHEEEADRPAFTEHLVNWARITEVINDPIAETKNIYKWGQSEVNLDLLFTELQEFFWLKMFPAGISKTPPYLIQQFQGMVNGNFTDPVLNSRTLEVVLWFQPELDLNVRASFVQLPPQDGNAATAGIGITIEASTDVPISIDIANRTTLNVSGGLGASAGVYVALVPGQPPQIEIISPARDVGGVSLSLGYSTLPGEGVLIGEPTGNRLEIDQIVGEVGLELRLDDTLMDFFAEIELHRGQVVISGDGADGFLTRILPSDGIRSEFDLVAGVSATEGLYFRGSGALELTLPVHQALGPLMIESLYLRLDFDETGDLMFTAAASAGAEIGPVAASVDRIGVRVPISFPPQRDGNLGPLQIDKPQFKPPLGAGLVVSAGPVIGGGYLEFDSDNERYAGILQLKFSEIGITAIGLITTRMPDGSKGFSMLLILNVEFIPPIPLPYGFSIGAIGGLVGINRTMVLEVLREGVRNGTVDSILFPQDPIENAPRIISDLRAVFPPEEGRFVVGPMVRIGYGSPQFIYAEIAIIIELPMPIRVALLGQLAAFFPLPDEAIVELHIDVLGTIETDKQLISIDATIYDSRILTYTLTGDAALRLKWGDNPVFATSLGGFHPKFSPPPNFPSLRRLRLSLGAGNNPRFNCDAYMALTSNSLQFGALVEVYASYGATLQGNLGFDAPFYFSPFSFDAGLSGYVSAKYKGKKLAAIRLDLYLSGPTPWYAEGSATIEIPVFPDVDVHFEKTWGPSAPAIIEAVNPWDEFVAALNRPESWGSSLPAGRSMVESLRSLEEEEVAAGAGSTEPPPPKPIVVHPAGTLEVRQRVLPIDMRLYKFGNAPIAGHTKYNIEPGDFDHDYLEDYFARGQSEELSNEDKVSKPSYELFKNGIAIRSQVTAFNDSLTQECTLEYESEYINEDNVTETSSSLGKLEGARVRRLLAGAASKRSPLRTSGRQKYARIGKAAKVSVGTEGYALVNAADMTKAALPAAGESMTRMAADEALRETIAQNPDLEGELLVVPTYEVAA